MCILFVYINPEPKEGEYKVILANNRDEFYIRPTKPAYFWDTGILAGADMNSGREGGTWLGMTRNGNIACLLNILKPREDFLKDGAARGFLVVNFLLGDDAGLDYMRKVADSGVKYNDYNLVVLEPEGNSYKIGYLNSSKNVPQVLETGVLGFGNSVVEKPFKKVQKGKRKMEEVVRSFGTKDSEQQLIHELFQMMKDREMNIPDEQLEYQGRQHSEEILSELCRMWVACKTIKYGTRTTTVILVDHNDNVTYREKTMEEPIDIEDVKWIENNFDFKLHERS
ncbi:transport and Golgi organization 2 homolog [Penaeus japonicus]|uniref:transport and Golgi organization 2 homolog n=1 Tax=Penaeus japonicus TaxID=27405 RepID=UPI001C711122|nr:transport and Golgi organization 2 homolog [Penaeus japonicus]